MTVVSAIITSHCTAHASDSFLTSVEPGGECRILEGQQTKLVRVEAWRGALAYWGLARHSDGWSTLDWLRTQASQARKLSSAEAFARQLASDLSAELRKHVFRRDADKGLGIHFTGYEQVQNYWVPELFHIRNWTDLSYTAVNPAGVVATRETYAILKELPDRPDSHRDPACRLEVRDALQNGIMFYFNNGDPTLFNPIANAIFESFRELQTRRQVRDPKDLKTHLALVRRPIETVSRILVDLAKKGYRRIGGRPHDLAIRPSGIAVSTTGD
jgi:hypothetical protein